MKVETYISIINNGNMLHQNSPALFTYIHFGGYLSAVRDLASEDADVSAVDLDNLLDYIGSFRNQLKKELDKDELA